MIAFEVAVNKPLLAAAVANAEGGSDIELYDITSGSLLAAIPNASQTAIAGLRFSGDDTTLITTAPDRMVRVWNAADGSARGSFEAHKDSVTLSLIHISVSGHYCSGYTHGRRTAHVSRSLPADRCV